LIRFADYYPVSNGIENSIDKLTDRVKNGYSIVVFPEGTRSEDCSIGRFRKGAFYLAGTLNIDIIPVVLHGLGHVLPKKDFMLREGAITVQINPRITPKKTDLDDNFLSITKQTRNHYSNMYSVLSNREEKSDYFKSYIIHSYLYKGSGIERTIRRNLKADFQSINSYAGNGPVLVKNNGLGEFSFLFALVHKHVHVYAVDNDKDNIDIASACCGLPPNITICAEEELTDIQFEMVFNG
jgi:1-acyl-sn-glycerol-3-phosphate acyltransferase